MTAAVEWYVHADDDLYGSVYVDDSVSPYTATVTGYRTFRAWLAEIEAQVNAGAADYSIGYSPTLDRVVLAKSSGSDCGFRWASDSMARLLGWDAADDTATPAAVHTAPGPPDGIVLLLGWEIYSARPGRVVERQDYGHGRARGIPFGSGIVFELALAARDEAMRRLQEGPCSTGRVRIGDISASAALSSADTSGYVDGTWARLEPGTPVDRIAAARVARCEVHASAAPSAALPSGFDRSFGLLGRGYHLVLWASIEGIAQTFSERSIGLPDESVTLAVPDRTQFVWRIERDEGTTGSGQVRLGIIDPDDDLELFGGATAKARLTADLAYDDTTATVDDTTGFASSGAAYVGHERITYAAKTATSFTGLTRGSPLYSFRADAALSWGTISDRPIQWAGRMVYLWAALCDPYGARVTGRDVQLWVGEIASSPTYDSGAWWLDCESIFSRLKRAVGSATEGVLAPQSQFGLGMSSGPVVAVEKAAELHIVLTGPSSFEHASSVDIATLLFGKSEPSAASEYVWVPWEQILIAALVHARAQWIAESGPPSGIVPISDGLSMSDDGQWTARIKAQKTGAFPGDGTIRVGPVVMSDGNIWPGWSQQIAISKESLSPAKSKNGLKVWSGEFAPGLDGRTIDSCVVQVASEMEASGAPWPAAGVLALDGTDGTEIASYSGAFEEGGRAYLPGLVRGLQGTTKANMHQPGVAVQRYVPLSGTVGQQAATLLQSSGTGKRGNYDTADAGYGLPLDVVAQANLEAGPAGMLATDTAVAPGASLVEHLGGSLAVQGYAFAPVRSAGALLIGIRSINPWGVAAHSLTDADIRADAGPILREANPAPNVVELSPASLAGIERATTRVVLAEARLAEGERSVSYELPATTSALASLLQRSWGMQAMAARRGCVLYELQVTPERDWLPGQLVDIDTSHPALGASGMTARGRILESSRDIQGQCRISVLVRADALGVSPLCPSARVTSIAGATVTLTTGTVDGIEPLLVAGELVRIYEAGASAHSSDVGAKSLAGTSLELDSVPAWLDSTSIGRLGVYVTYPDASLCSARQRAYVQSEDGSQWL